MVLIWRLLNQESENVDYTNQPSCDLIPDLGYFVCGLYVHVQTKVLISLKQPFVYSICTYKVFGRNPQKLSNTEQTQNFIMQYDSIVLGSQTVFVCLFFCFPSKVICNLPTFLHVAYTCQSFCIYFFYNESHIPTCGNSNLFNPYFFLTLGGIHTGL